MSREGPDVVVVATGSVPLSLSVPGSALAVTAHDILAGNVTAGPRVAVIGGGMIGAETAYHLAHHGKEVTIVEMLPAVAQDEEDHTRSFLLKGLADQGVTIYVKATVIAIADEGLIIEQGGRRETIGPFDTVVRAAGLKPRSGFQSKIEEKAGRIITIGDAAGVRKALEAVAEGYRAGLEI